MAPEAFRIGIRGVPVKIRSPFGCKLAAEIGQRLGRADRQGALVHAERDA